MGATGRVRIGIAILFGTLFRLALLAGIAVIAIVDVTFFLPQAHGSGVALNVLLLPCCALLAWYVLRPMLAPRRTFFLRRTRPSLTARPPTRATQSRATQSRATQPRATQPGATQPGATAPRATRSRGSQPPDRQLADTTWL